MGRGDLTRSIVIIVFGGVAMIGSMVTGIVRMTGSLYEDLAVFPARLVDARAGAQQTEAFQLPNEEVSLWLRMPSRRIENKSIGIEVDLIGASDEVLGDVSEDFRLGYMRSSAGPGQYYKLGAYEGRAEGARLRYRVSGDYVPESDGALAVRRRLPFQIPFVPIGGFALGAFVLALGVRSLVGARA